MPLDGSLGEADEEPLYLVCTHGKHDPCCGQRGRPLVIALSAARPDRVWQASHLGGCRFAPTVLTLPLGLMYGRVPPSAASDLVVATDRGLVVGPFLRGRIGLAPAVQAALAFAHEQLALPACSDVSPLSMQSIDAARVGVRVTSRRGRFEVTVERRRMTAADLTCGAPGLSWFLAHRGVAIEPVDSN
ncbi:MAG TPA: sucrase ferredoxin [Solirubrobacterales bacterium]